MATNNPFEEFLNSEVDESAISALVGSLETELASPTSKDPAHQNSTVTVNSNHIDGTRAGGAISTHSEVHTQAGQKAGLIQNNLQINATRANGSKDSVSQTQLLGLNSIVTSTVASTNSTSGVSLLPNSHSPLSSVGANVKFNATIKPETNSQHGPNGVPKQVIVTVGSTNTGTIPSLGSQQTNCVISQNSVVQTTNSSSGNVGIHNLASLAAAQPPLSVPNNSSQMKTQPVIQHQIIDHHKDNKQGVTTIAQGTPLSKPQFLLKQDPAHVNPQVQTVKQEVKVLTQPHVVASSSPVPQQTINIVTSAVKTTAPANSGIITITKPATSIGQQQMTVVRPQTSQIQILNRAATASAQAKMIAPRASAPIRIAPQQPTSQVIRAPGQQANVSGQTITLPPGLQLPPGTVLMKNEHGQIVFVSGQQQGAALQSQPNTTAAQPGAATYKIQTVRGGKSEVPQQHHSPHHHHHNPHMSPHQHQHRHSPSQQQPMLPPHHHQQHHQHHHQQHHMGQPSLPPRPSPPPQLHHPVSMHHHPHHLPRHAPHMQQHPRQPNAVVTTMQQPSAMPSVMSISSPHQMTPPTSVRPQQVMTSPAVRPAGVVRPQIVRPQVTQVGGPVVQGTAAAGVQPIHNPAVTQVQATQAAHKVGAAGGAIVNNKDNNLMDNVKKCKNFLSTLIKLASNQPANTVRNVRQLIQGLIDGKIEPEMFTARLQVELKSSPQPYLVPFLKKSLPQLRQSLMLRQMEIEGVRPPATTAGTATVASPGVMQIQGAQRPILAQMPGKVRQLTQPQLQQLVMQQKLQQHKIQQLHGAANQTKSLLQQGTKPMLPTTVSAMQARQRTSVSPAATPTRPEKRKYESLKDDDDINDVATMGGVNLTEESRNILAANSELMSGQLRSCRDENFLFTSPLVKRINAACQRHGLNEIPTEVASLISHATQERLRTVLEKLATIAEHRMEIYKTDRRFEVSNETRLQIKFLEELDRLEKKRHEEAEREVLLRAAKSRSKHEDPEQLKLKEKAKALQQAEMEELRQREANLTALAAIGPRKKKKMEDAQGSSSTQGSSSNQGSTPSRSGVMLRPRLKRVNLKDLVFLMEQERESCRSNLLYKSYLK